jgi:hypothetical protein
MSNRLEEGIVKYLPKGSWDGGESDGVRDVDVRITEYYDKPFIDGCVCTHCKHAYGSRVSNRGSNRGSNDSPDSCSSSASSASSASSCNLVRLIASHRSLCIGIEVMKYNLISLKRKEESIEQIVEDVEEGLEGLEKVRVLEMLEERDVQVVEEREGGDEGGDTEGNGSFVGSV